MTIDSHCHLHDEKFSADLDEVIIRAEHAGVTHFISVGCDIKTTQAAASVAAAFPSVYFTAGFHPHDAKDLSEQAKIELRALALMPKCVAIGECGLDYFYLHSTIEEQKHAFIFQLKLARELSLPVVIHLRDAYDDCIEILKQHPQILSHTVIHCFSGTLEQAKIFTGMGCFISLSGIVTFKNPGELREVAKHIALEKLVIETDAPYLAPHPHRGKRNEPSLIVHTLNAVADARGVAPEDISQQLEHNTRAFFKL